MSEGVNSELVKLNKEIEMAELTEEQVAALALEQQGGPLESKDVQIAAGQFSQLVKEIKGRAKAMKAGGLARVFIAVSEFPFSAAYPKFRTQAETDLFLLFLANGKAKGVIHEALKGMDMDMQSAAVDNVTNKILDDVSKNTKGETRG